MSSTITVRDIEPEDKAWLRREARRLGISMEELVRRLIRRGRERARLREKPSEAFRKYFGPDHGIDLSARQRFGYRPMGSVDEGAE